MDIPAIADNFRRIVTAHYFDTRGRVGRSEFWYFALACLVLAIMAGILTNLTFLPLNAMLGLALLLPMAGIGARRLHDTGRDGRLVWAMLGPVAVFQLLAILTWGPFGWLGFLAFYLSIGWVLGLIAMVAMIALVWFWCQPGDAGDNAYGPPPPRPLPPPNF